MHLCLIANKPKRGLQQSPVETNMTSVCPNLYIFPTRMSLCSQEGETKSEWDNEAAKDQEADVAEADNSPLKFDENDDDDPDRWGQYIY